jgi:hypothetical protein
VIFIIAPTVLTDDEIKAIDDAGAKGPRGFNARVLLHRASLLLVGGIVGFGLCSYLGIDFL